MKISKKLSAIFSTFVFCVLIAGCTKESGFKSNFESSEKRTWIGAQYWANPIQDWHIENGELICNVSKPNRNVHHLTKRGDSIKGNFGIKVFCKIMNLDKAEKGLNWAGFSIGSKGEFNDYRSNAITGKGLDIGISTTGKVFIGDVEMEITDSGIAEKLKSGLTLEVISNYISADNYEVLFNVFEGQSEQPIVSLKKEGLRSNDVRGDLVLVSHFERGTKQPNTESVRFKDWEIKGENINTCDECEFGPVLFSQYTLSRNTLKLTAQLAPVTINDQQVHLEIFEDGEWVELDASAIDEDARTAHFKIENWNRNTDVEYRLKYALEEKAPFNYYSGIIREEPLEKDELVIAGFTGNDDMAFPNTDIVNQVKYQNPDVLFFSGDQLYESNGGYGAQRSPTDKAMLDYLRKWYLFGWSFGEVLKDRPSVIIVDDHDVYHGNIWGSGGIPTPPDFGQGAKAQDAGGYKMPATFVNMVERTQTSHLPDPFDPTPVAQGIGVYYTDMVYGGISFGIIEDRKFKSAPKGLLPEADIWNGWIQNKNFHPKDADIPEAILLGERQQHFLNEWVSDWSGKAEMKMLLSQTIFANVATLPEEAMSGAVIPTLRILNEGEYPPNDRPVADFDSNGWPQTGRNQAVSTLRKGFVFHLAGDQHLGSTIHYGVDEWNDSGYAFCVPSIANHWPRRWYPQKEGGNRNPKMPKYTGEFKDGFGNKMTVWAASNPLYTNKKPSRLYDRSAGYGIVRLNKPSREITMECWPIQANPEKGVSEMYSGWPITVSQEMNYGRSAGGYLPEITVSGIKKPVVKVYEQDSKELLYALRISGNTFKPKVFDNYGKYIIKVGDPDLNLWEEFQDIEIGTPEIQVNF